MISSCPINPWASFPITTEFPITLTTSQVVVQWSNFEIADMNFWRGPASATFFEHLDSTGGLTIRCISTSDLLVLDPE
ncbi:hypothetical protein BD779DRAFT_1557300 [Infundibulicybe gibba]|nr:hypothetical protein BD779DRAFT_1557300 [Infundibulicybe gibba]